ncbi:BTAD domain-containing putative transcriptional regulator [Kitasatospora sp. NPDC052896]|uniref:AfsR/SARP family transcriptional regulator n=1 Tax=Kitasatospora sp. NPDC052896 TaxID=3364061 RepID=UPI0037C8C269
MKYQLLGSLRVIDGNTTSFVSAQKVETLLAALLVRSDHVVTADQLMTELWGERLPRRAAAGLHVYVSELRKFLSRPGRADSPIVTRSSGYVLRLRSDEIDYQSFLELTDLGRKLLREQRPEEAVDCFERGLALWRGPALGDIGDGPILRSFATWLTEVRLDCAEMHVDAQLQLGHHRELVGHLFALIAESPLRETFYRQLMIALYRSERRAEALKVYQSARGTLIDELGLEPCSALQELHRAILAADDRVLAGCSAG